MWNDDEEQIASSICAPYIPLTLSPRTTPKFFTCIRFGACFVILKFSDAMLRVSDPRFVWRDSLIKPQPGERNKRLAELIVIRLK